MPLYLIGIIPLRKTLRAAKEPHEDLAKHLLKSAKIWNIGISSFILVSILIYIVIYIVMLNR